MHLPVRNRAFPSSSRRSALHASTDLPGMLPYGTLAGTYGWVFHLWSGKGRPTISSKSGCCPNHSTCPEKMSYTAP